MDTLNSYSDMDNKIHGTMPWCNGGDHETEALQHSDDNNDHTDVSSDR